MKNEREPAEFSRLFEQWEQYLKARFGQSNMHRLSQKFWEVETNRCKKEGISENELLALVNIRNTLAHNPSFLEIKQPTVTMLRKLVNTFCKRAFDIAVPKQKIYKVNLASKIVAVVNTMKNNLFTHVPVVEDKKFFGIFSENTLLKIISSQKELKEGLKIEDIKSLLKDTQGTDDYRFLSSQATFYAVYQLFQDHIDKGKRLGVVFLTEEGEESGDIKGLITAWDLHKGLQD